MAACSSTYDTSGPRPSNPSGASPLEIVSTRQKLTSHIPRIQTPRHGRVRRALDDGASVGKERHLIRVAPEFQHEVVMADSTVRLKAQVHLGEVDGALPLMDLHGIPAAQGDVWAALAGEVNEVAFAAG